ncbi:MAG TPA: c-type cytochrome [Rhodocyclaceae bacterium]
MKKIHLALILGLCSTAALAAPSAPAACAECHGANGVATASGVPHLNGQLAEYLSDTMEAFKAGKRPSSTPTHADPALTEKDIADLSKFYAKQKKAQRPEQAADPAKVAAAEDLYKRRCSKCHVFGGRDSDHDAPLMAGQSLEYLQKQTEAYVSGKRKFPFLMDEAYLGLSKEELERLSHYFASQR